MASEITAATTESGCMLDEEILATVRKNSDKPSSVNVLRKRYNVGWGRAKRLFKLYRAEELGCSPSDVPILPPGARPQGGTAKYTQKKRKSRESQVDRKEKGKRRQKMYKISNNSISLDLREADLRAERIASLLTPNTRHYFAGKNNHVLAEGLPEIMRAKEALMRQQQQHLQNHKNKHGFNSIGTINLKSVSHAQFHR